MESSLGGVVRMSQTLMESVGTGPLHEKLRLQTEELNTLFADIVKRIRSHSALLCDTVEQLHKLLENIHQLDVWIDQVTAENLQADVAASTTEELSKLEANLKVNHYFFDVVHYFSCVNIINSNLIINCHIMILLWICHGSL
jgi:hypothetical protein